MSALADLYPFFLLGLRRASERAGALGLATTVTAAIAFLPAIGLLGMPWLWDRALPFLEQPDILGRPAGLYVVLAYGLCLACFAVPFFAAGASDLFFRTDWRANSILLASPLSSRTLFWGKFALLFTVGLPALVPLVPPLAALFLGVLPTGLGFLRLFGLALLVYFVSALFLCGFSRRWEAILFWVFLLPLSAVLNGMVYFTVWLGNHGLSGLHSFYPNSRLVALLPTDIPYPHIPLWVLVVILLALTLTLLLGRGSAELERMRTGLIPLGRLTRKSIDEYKRRKSYRWLRPAYIRSERASVARELYVPVLPGQYAPTATDRLFGFLVAIAFLGKGTVHRLLELLPVWIRDNPIYTRGAARFRGFLAGYFEPSGRYKSRVVMLLVPLLGLGLVLLVAGVLLPALLIAYIIFVLFSPVDAYIRLARRHRRHMAWESVILAPIPGAALIGGSFGALLAHRFVPLLPGSLWIIMVGAFSQADFPGLMTLGTTAVLLLLHGLHFAGLSFAAGCSWHISNRLLASGLLVPWALAIGFIVFQLFPGDWLTGRGGLITFLIAPSNLSAIDSLTLLAAAAVLTLLGLAWPVILGALFDRFSRYPFPRREEEGE